MGVKAVEYNSKWKHGLLWAGAYDPHVKHDEHEAEPEVSAPAAEAPPAAAKEIGAAVDAAAEPATEDDPANRIEASNIAPAADGPAGLADPTAAGEAADDEMLQPANAQIYFSIYFLLTGLHGIHVLGGIGAFVWLFRSASAGYFDSGHFTRVDMVALYWHLVDLIWIYLFFLLYLIH
jgi:cytochrome c oxidase subunit 3